MFELADADLIDGLSAAARTEAAAIARRLALIGALDSRRERELAETIFWRTDPFEEVAAEVSAALAISGARAGAQIRYARALRDKLPQVAAVFATGAIDYRVVRTLITRTATVDAAVITDLDAAFDQRLDALAATVCDNDPRTHQQRRSAALGPLSRLQAQLPCRCGSAECPAAATRAAAHAEQQRQHQAWLAANYQPPPF
ncbi:MULTISPECIES: DUF222 domain-containing protein [unclassified Mycolicibacterium]|uniref:DUF222 domain-containing protein n=1 Tax=unclassified Mycolicibacterium TaxID=2636767 RepID=UPI002ED7780A